jgi:hypothetical protein
MHGHHGLGPKPPAHATACLPNNTRQPQDVLPRSRRPPKCCKARPTRDLQPPTGGPCGSRLVEMQIPSLPTGMQLQHARVLETSAADILQPEASRNLLLNLGRIEQRRLCHTGTSPPARLSFPEPLLVKPSTTYPHTQAAHAVQGMPPQPTSPYVTSKLSKRAGPLQDPTTQHSSVRKGLM